MISSFLFANKVSAEENVIIDCSNSEFSNYCSGTFTSDDLNSIIELNNIDTSVYSNVLLLFNYKDRSKFNYFYIFFYSSESQINFYNENNIFIDGPALYLTFSKYNGLVDLSSLNYSNVTSLTNGQLQLNFTIKSIAYNGPISDISNISSNEFNEDIDVTDISKIKINFDLPEDTSNLDVDIKWTFDNYTSGGDGYITTPYLEFKHSNGDITLSQDISNLNGGDWFSDNYIATLLPDSDITEISLIVDTVKASGLLKVNFSSKFPYSISYEYTEEIEDYFITIDMDDYASISLIPKVYNLENGISSSISSPIYKYGIYDVEIWEDLETKKVIDRWDNHSTSQFIYPMYSGYKNCVIHFIKKEVDASNRYIKFDSRHYVYVLKKYLNEEVTITNPNTGEDMIIPDISDLYKYDSPVDKRFSFNSFLKPIKFVFSSITDFYNNYCPEVVQYYFYLIFAFFVILVLIKIFL